MSARRAQSLDRLASIYGRGNLYIELQRHQQRDEECRNQSLLDLASASAFAGDCDQWRALRGNEKDREMLDVFTAIRHHTTLDQAGRLLTANAMRASAHGA